MKETSLMETSIDNSDLVYSDSSSVKGSGSGNFVKGVAAGVAGTSVVAGFVIWWIKKKLVKKAADDIRKEFVEGIRVQNESEEKGDGKSEK